MTQSAANTYPPQLRTAAHWAKSDTQKAHVLADHFAHVFQPYDSELPDVEKRKILHPQAAPSRLETSAKKIQNYRSTGCDKTHAYKKKPRVMTLSQGEYPRSYYTTTTTLTRNPIMAKKWWVLFQYVIYRAIFVPICDLPLTTPHTTSDVPPATP
jgi:hypothetical protein